MSAGRIGVVVVVSFGFFETGAKSFRWARFVLFPTYSKIKCSLV